MAKTLLYVAAGVAGVIGLGLGGAQLLAQSRADAEVRQTLAALPAGVVGRVETVDFGLFSGRLVLGGLTLERIGTTGPARLQIGTLTLFGVRAATDGIPPKAEAERIEVSVPDAGLTLQAARFALSGIVAQTPAAATAAPPAMTSPTTPGVAPAGPEVADPSPLALLRRVGVAELRAAEVAIGVAQPGGEDRRITTERLQLDRIADGRIGQLAIDGLRQAVRGETIAAARIEARDLPAVDLATLVTDPDPVTARAGAFALVAGGVTVRGLEAGTAEARRFKAARVEFSGLDRGRLATLALDELVVEGTDTGVKGSLATLVVEGLDVASFASADLDDPEALRTALKSAKLGRFGFTGLASEQPARADKAAWQTLDVTGVEGGRIAGVAVGGIRIDTQSPTVGPLTLVLERLAVLDLDLSPVLEVPWADGRQLVMAALPATFLRRLELGNLRLTSPIGEGGLEHASVDATRLAPGVEDQAVMLRLRLDRMLVGPTRDLELLKLMPFVLDISADLRTDQPGEALLVRKLGYALPDAAAIEVSGSVERLDLARLQAETTRLGAAGASAEAISRAWLEIWGRAGLKDLRISVLDQGLIPRLQALQAREEGIELEVVESRWSDMIGAIAEASQANARLSALAGALRQGLDRPGRLELTIRPDTALTLGDVPGLAAVPPPALADMLKLEARFTPQ